MNRRRLLAAIFFSIVVVATLAVIVYTEHANADQTLPVWVLTRDVTAGAPFSTDDVQQVRIPAPDGTFNYELQAPGQAGDRYARNLHAQDILRVDDLTSEAALGEVSLSIQNAPPLNAGDSVDVFATLPDGQQARIGRSITVVSASGSALDVLVPSADEAAWVAIGSSATTLHAVRTVPGTDPHPTPISAGDAIGILCGSACVQITTPAPSP